MPQDESKYESKHEPRRTPGEEPQAHQEQTQPAPQVDPAALPASDQAEEAYPDHSDLPAPLAASLHLVEQLFRQSKLMEAPPELAEKVIAALNEAKEKSPVLRWLRKRFNLP